MKIMNIIQAQTMVRFYTSNNIFGTWEQRFYKWPNKLYTDSMNLFAVENITVFICKFYSHAQTKSAKNIIKI